VNRSAGRRSNAVTRRRDDGTITGVAKADGFDYQVRADGSVVITHRGRVAATLRHGRAATFLAEAERGDPQEVMARWTGNYRRGNERTARNHPRNAHR
jgi:hypothetical protein